MSPPVLALRAVAWAALIGTLLATALPAGAETSWTRLPSDAEIEMARTRLQEDRTFKREDCAAQCGNGEDVAVMVCRAKACMDRCRLGPEIVDSALTQVETIKAHQPLEANVPASAFVFALTTTTVTRDDCNGRIWSEIGYGIEMLAWRDSGWYWSGNRLGLEVRQQDPGNKAQRDAEFASYFGPERLVLGFPQAADAAAAEPYRLTVKADDATHPLRLLIFVERLRPASGPLAHPDQAIYDAAADTKVSLGAISYAGNESRLAVHLESPDCRNCEDEFTDGRRVQRVGDIHSPILLQTDAYGYARVELFLDFAALAMTGQLPPASGLVVPLQIGVLAPPEPGQRERLQKEMRFEARLSGIGVVDAVHFQPSRPAGDPRLYLPLVPLSQYLDDPGTRDGERLLTTSDRVKVKRFGEALIMEPGSAPGSTLRAGHILQVGDLITVNACGTDTRPIVDGLPAGLPAQIWVTVRFFDGLRGQFGVNAQVCRSALTIGRSRNDSGFLTLGQRFIYWAAELGIDAVIEWLFERATLVTTPREVLGWVRQGLGYDASYVILNSAVAVESTVEGGLWISTRAGEPRVLTAATGEEGVAVPAGMTGTVSGDDVRVDVSDSERSARADAWLSRLQENAQALAGGPGSSDAETAIDADAPGEPYHPAYPPTGSESGSAPWAAIGLALSGVVVLGIWLGKRRAARMNAAPTARRRARKSPTTCPGCGRPVGASARFCGACGKPLAAKPSDHS